MNTEDGGVEPDWQRTALEYAKRIHVLEAKVARAVELLENGVLPLCSEEGEIEHAVKQALEALR